MVTFLLFMLKVGIFGFVGYLLMGFFNTILASIGVLVLKTGWVGKIGLLVYAIFVSIINIYLFSFWGAYYASIVDTYSVIYAKWVVVLFCILNILLWTVGIGKWMNAEKGEMNRFTSIGDDKAAYGKSIYVAALSMCVFILISFITFLFAGGLALKMYYSIPEITAQLFFTK